MRLLNKAIFLAKKNTDKKQFFFSCVAKRNDGAEVYSVNHCVRAEKVPAHHAEARAVRKCDVGAILYVARILRDKETPALAKPCKFCQAFIRNKGIKKVYFTIDSNQYGIWDVEEDIWNTLEY